MTFNTDLLVSPEEMTSLLQTSLASFGLKSNAVPGYLLKVHELTADRIDEIINCTREGRRL